jgi:hypothetical protein
MEDIMRKLALASIAIVALLAVVVSASEDKPWFDLEKCAFCKTLTAEPGLLDHMKSHFYDINNGVLSVTEVDKEFQPAFKRAQENMQKIIAGMANGNIPYMCQYCTKVGTFQMMGVKTSEVPTDFGTVVVWSAPDSSIAGQLRAFGARTNDEFAKMAAEKK